MSCRLRVVMIVLAASAALAPARLAVAAMTPEQRQSVLAEAQDAYDSAVAILRKDPGRAKESFRESARRFQQLVDDGAVTGPLLFNLGNARLQSGELGAAILDYRRAERLIPSDPKLAHNLEHARSLRRNQMPSSGGRALASALFGWHETVPAGSRLALFGVAWIAFWSVLGVITWRTASNGSGIGHVWWIAVAAVVVWGATGTSLAFTWWGPSGPTEGVTLADDIIVRKGNGVGFEPQFAESLHQGVELTVLTERAGWTQIELPDGKTGWVPADAVGIIGE